MQTTGAELAGAAVKTDGPLPASPAVAGGSSGESEAPDGDGFPFVAAIVVLVALLGVGGWLKSRNS
jgi:hypothetical protein